MLWLIITVALFLTPSLATAADSFNSGSYAIILSPDRDSYGEGLLFNFESIEKRTRIFAGVFYTENASDWTQEEPLSFDIASTAAIEGIVFDMDISLDDIGYTKKYKSTIYDFMVFGEYNYWKHTWSLRKGDNWRKQHEFKLYAGGGAKVDMRMNKTVYNLYANGEYVDRIENPLSGSNGSGIKFFLTNSIFYRFSLFHVGINPAIVIPDFKKSFVLFAFGLTM